MFRYWMGTSFICNLSYHIYFRLSILFFNFFIFFLSPFPLWGGWGCYYQNTPKQKKKEINGADGSRTHVQKIFTNHKSHSYLTGFVYTVLSILFTIYKSQEQVLILRSFTTANLLERFICAAIFVKLIRLCFSLIALILRIKVA